VATPFIRAATTAAIGCDCQSICAFSAQMSQRADGPVREDSLRTHFNIKAPACRQVGSRG